MDEKQYQALAEKLGKETADKMKTEMDGYVQGMKKLLEGKASVEEMKSFETNLKASVEELKGILAKQGTTMQEVLAKIAPEAQGAQSIAKQLYDDKAELEEIYKSRNRYKEYMLTVNEKGKMVMKPFDSIKATGPNATISGINGGSAASVSQNIDATSLLRMGADAPIFSQFRNTPWIFALCNLVNTSFAEKFAIWFDEQAKSGASTAVAEGATKPLSQYLYQINTKTYKKEAVLIGFTEEFTLDFERLQNDILSKGQIDLVNRINTAILPNITSAATTYNSSVAYKGVDGIQNPNDWDVLAALAAQVENSTFSSMANGAVISSNRKYRMGTQKDTQGRWLDRPSILDQVNITSNPAQAANAVLVGDFKQYNILLRGGMIVRVGYNGTDFAQNMFSTVIEQYYFDYISTIRAAAIVSGPDFPTVKTAIAAA